jgi:hypothetical protein
MVVVQYESKENVGHRLWTARFHDRAAWKLTKGWLGGRVLRHGLGSRRAETTQLNYGRHLGRSP